MTIKYARRAVVLATLIAPVLARAQPTEGESPPPPPPDEQAPVVPEAPVTPAPVEAPVPADGDGDGDGPEPDHKKSKKTGIDYTPRRGITISAGKAHLRFFLAAE